METQTVLCFDPGCSLGYAVVVYPTKELIAADVFTTDTSESLGSRLFAYQEKIADLIREYQPDVVVVEAVNRVRSVAAHDHSFMLQVIYGLVLMKVFTFGVSHLNISPNTLKKAATGNGKAKKPEVTAAANKFFKTDYRNNNITDALGLYMAFVQAVGG